MAHNRVGGKTLLILTLDGVLVGAVTGVLVLLYRLITDYFSNWILKFYENINPLHILALLVIFFIFSVIIRKLINYSPLSSGSGIPQIIGELYGYFDMNEIRVIIAKFIGGSMSAIGGLSLGREGPSIQIGGACGKLISKLIGQEDKKKSLIAAGAGAGLAGAFSAPISGFLITIEEFTKTFNPLILIPTLSATITASIISKLIYGLDLAFSFTITDHLPLEYYYHVILLGIFIGLLGVCFNELLFFIQRKMKSSNLNGPLLPFAAFALAIVFGVFYPYVMGGGHNIVESIEKYHETLQLLIKLLLLKLIFTAVSFGSGVQGGTLVPTLAIGAVGGAIYFTLINKLGVLKIEELYFTNFIILGMAGMLASVLRSPLTSIILVCEMTGSYVHFAAFGIVVVVSYVTAELMKCNPFYEALLDRMVQEKSKKEVV